VASSMRLWRTVLLWLLLLWLRLGRGSVLGLRRGAVLRLRRRMVLVLRHGRRSLLRLRGRVVLRYRHWVILGYRPGLVGLGRRRGARLRGLLRYSMVLVLRLLRSRAILRLLWRGRGSGLGRTYVALRGSGMILVLWLVLLCRAGRGAGLCGVDHCLTRMHSLRGL
jgi:hypothetical protein